MNEQNDFNGILPTTLEGHVNEEVSPGVWLITNPTYCPEVGEWRALANVGGALAVVQLRAYVTRLTQT